MQMENMKLYKECPITSFSGFYDKRDKNRMVHLEGEDFTVKIDEMILSLWSTNYEKLYSQEDGDVIRLTGYSEKEVEDCVALLYGLNVLVKPNNIVAFARFSEYFSIKDLNMQIEELFKRRLEDEFLIDAARVVLEMKSKGLKITSSLKNSFKIHFNKNLKGCIAILRKYMSYKLLILYARIADELDIQEINKEIEIWFKKQLHSEQIVQSINSVSNMKVHRLPIAKKLNKVTANYMSANRDRCNKVMRSKNKDVYVNSANAIEIAKFAAKEKIPELEEGIKSWMESELKDKNNIIEILKLLSEMHEKELAITETLTEITRAFLRENLSKCEEQIKQHSEHFDTFTLKLFLDDDYLFRNTLSIIKSKIYGEEQCIMVLKRMENLPSISAKCASVPPSYQTDCNELFDKIRITIKDPEILNHSLAQITLMSSSYRLDLSPKTTNITAFQTWRNFSTYDVKRLHLNKDITEFEFVTIFLDWIEYTRPAESDVIGLYNEIDQSELMLGFSYKIQTVLRDTPRYKNLPW